MIKKTVEGKIKSWHDKKMQKHTFNTEEKSLHRLKKLEILTILSILLTDKELSVSMLKNFLREMWHHNCLCIVESEDPVPADVKMSTNCKLQV